MRKTVSVLRQRFLVLYANIQILIQTLFFNIQKYSLHQIKLNPVCPVYKTIDYYKKKPQNNS